MNNQLEVFKNEEFGEVRILVIDDKPWFVGKDVVEKLGYKIDGTTSYSKYIKQFCDEDDYKKLNNSKLELFNINDLGRKGGYLINESGFYSLVLSSDLPTAKNFKKWVTGEVLPTIRKTGGYVANEDMFITTYLPFADDSTKALFKTTLTTIREQNAIIKKQQDTITAQESELTYKEDVIIGLTDEIDVAEKRQILNRVVRHKGANYRERWSVLYREFEAKYHIDLGRRLANYNETHKPKIKSKIDYIEKVMDKIPELYEIATKLFESDIKDLVEEMYNII